MASCPVADINILSLGTREHFCDIICIDLHIQCCHLSQGLQPLAGEASWPAAGFLWQAAWQCPPPQPSWPWTLRPPAPTRLSELRLCFLLIDRQPDDAASQWHSCFSGPGRQLILLLPQVKKTWESGISSFIHSIV